MIRLFTVLVTTRINKYSDCVSAFDTLETELIAASSNPVRDSIKDVSELVQSIREHGLLQPILVRPRGERFEVVAGNRRLKACKQLRYRKIKAIVTELGDKESYEVALTENVQRKSLSPLEEAVAFKKYCDTFGRGSQTELARKIGKSQEYISHRIKLLSLPKEAIAALDFGKISVTSAQELMWAREEVQGDALRLMNEQKYDADASRTLVRVLNDSVDKSVNTYAQSSPLGGEEEETREQRLMSEAVLILRIALIRLDAIIAKTQGRSRHMLASKRTSLHKLIDELIVSKKSYQSGVLEHDRVSSPVPIVKLIKVR